MNYYAILRYKSWNKYNTAIPFFIVVVVVIVFVVSVCMTLLSLLWIRFHCWLLNGVKCWRHFFTTLTPILSLLCVLFECMHSDTFRYTRISNLICKKTRDYCIKFSANQIEKNSLFLNVHFYSLATKFFWFVFSTFVWLLTSFHRLKMKTHKMHRVYALCAHYGGKHSKRKEIQTI